MTFVVQASQVPTGSMENTMLIGDFLLVNKMAYTEPVLPFANERPDRLTESFNAAAKRAGLDEFRYHDLRHGFGSRLAQAGVPIPTIQRLMGHADVAQTMRYAGHLPENAERDAIALADRARKLAPKESNVSA